jgi:cytoskeletal protein CcmA (bactofilin family)
MWKREKPEPVELEKVMTERPPVWVTTSRPVASPPPVVVDPPPAAVATVEASQASPGKVSILGATLCFKGDLVADEDLVIQGLVEGSILHTRSLTIGVQGRMVGQTRARRLLVEGAVEGDLYALESVTMRSGAIVRGDVFAPRLSIEEGVRLSGRVDMDNAPTVPTVKIPTPAAESAETTEISDQEAGALLSG